MKDRIVEAVWEEIRQRGLRFSMRDAAARLGISTKTLYQHFESKEQIIECIVENAVQQMIDTEQQWMKDDSLTVTEKLHKILTVLPQGMAFHEFRLLQELKLRYPNQWKVVDDYKNYGWDRIRRLAEEGIKEGVLRPFDMELFIRVYVGGLEQLMDRPTNGGNRSLEETLNGLADLLLNGIVSRELTSK